MAKGSDGLATSGPFRNSLIHIDDALYTERIRCESPHW